MPGSIYVVIRDILWKIALNIKSFYLKVRRSYHAILPKSKRGGGNTTIYASITYAYQKNLNCHKVEKLINARISGTL